MSDVDQPSRESSVVSEDSQPPVETTYVLNEATEVP